MDFVINVETHILTNSEKVKQELKQIIKGYNINRGLTKNLREQINSKLGDIEIQWWGDFSDLRSGRSKFSKEIIIAFVNSLPEDKKDGTATIKHVNEFIEFCKHWGH